MNIVRDEIAVQEVREERKLADSAAINKPPPFTPSEPAMDSSPNINNNNPNTPYQSYRKPLKRNNPVSGSTLPPKIPPFAAINRPSGPPGGATSAASFNSSSTSGAPMSKKSKEDSECHAEETPKPGAENSTGADIYQRDKSRVPSGLGRAVFKKPFDCKMVLKTRSPSKLLCKPPPPVIVDTLIKQRDNHPDLKGHNKEESLSDWLNPRPSRNEVEDRPSDKTATDIRPGGDLVNSSDPPMIPGLSGGNITENHHSREPWKNPELRSNRANEPKQFGSDSRSGDFKGRDPARGGTRWGDNDNNSNRNEDRRQSSHGWLDGGGAAYAKQFEGKPGFAPSRGRGNSGSDQDTQDVRTNSSRDYNRQGSHHRNESGGGSGSYNNEYNHRNQDWRHKDHHGDSNNRNWRPNGDRWNNERDRGSQGNGPNWRNSSRNQSAWTASGDRRASENSERSNWHRNERFAQFEQNWNTGRNQGSNKTDSSIQRQGLHDQNVRPNFNTNHPDADDGKEIIIGQHMSSLNGDPFQNNDIPNSQPSQQTMAPFNNPPPFVNPPFNSFPPHQMLPPNLPSSGPNNFVAGNTNPSITHFNPQVPLNPPASGVVNASAGQSFPNTNAIYNSQAGNMSIPGVPVSSAPAYNWTPNAHLSNVSVGVATSFKESSAVLNHNSGVLNSNPSNAAPTASNFYSGYQSSNVSMPSTVATPSVAPGASMSGQVPVSQAANYTSEQLQDYQKQWDDYKVKWEKYQQELAEYNKKMQEANGTMSAAVVQNPQQQQPFASVASSVPMVASVPQSPIVQQQQQPAAALQQMTSALGGIPSLSATGQLNLQAAAAVLQPNLTPNLGNNLLLNQSVPANAATVNPYQHAASAQAMMSTLQQQQQQPAATAFNYAQFYPNAATNPTAATLQQAAGLMSMTNPAYPGAVNFAAASQIPSFYPASGTSGVAAVAATNPLSMINPMATPAGSGAPM